MQFSPEVWVAAAIAAVAFLVGLLYLRARSKRTRSVGRKLASGPSNLRFTCAGCKGQFTHSRRTIGAWDKGQRSFFCNACHTKWLGANPPSGKRGAARVITGAPQGGSGCLGVAILLIAVPVGVALAVLQYA
jgi:hypothetical protein